MLTLTLTLTLALTLTKPSDYRTFGLSSSPGTWRDSKSTPSTRPTGLGKGKKCTSFVPWSVGWSRIFSSCIFLSRQFFSQPTGYSHNTLCSDQKLFAHHLKSTLGDWQSAYVSVAWTFTRPKLNRHSRISLWQLQITTHFVQMQSQGFALGLSVQVTVGMYITYYMYNQV